MREEEDIQSAEHIIVKPPLALGAHMTADCVVVPMPQALGSVQLHAVPCAVPSGGLHYFRELHSVPRHGLRELLQPCRELRPREIRLHAPRRDP